MADENLKNTDKDFSKVFSIIDTDKIENRKDFNILIDNLTDHPDPVREATAFKLEEINDYSKEFFCDEFALSKILNAIIDINPNVSRTICKIIENNPRLQSLLEEKIIDKLFQILNNITNKDNTHLKNTKSHAKNKLIFALYWYLEALSYCISDRYGKKVQEILTKTIKFYDYTIREKTAKLLAKMPDAPIDLLQIAKSDQNFYVKYQVYDKIIKD